MEKNKTNKFLVDVIEQILPKYSKVVVVGGEVGGIMIGGLLTRHFPGCIKICLSSKFKNEIVNIFLNFKSIFPQNSV